MSCDQCTNLQRQNAALVEALRAALAPSPVLRERRMSHRKIQAAVAALADCGDSDGWPTEPIPREKVIELQDDMHPGRRLQILIQDDGDACLNIILDNGTSSDEVEFCTRLGGGSKYRTVRALHHLAVAMLHDSGEGTPARQECGTERIVVEDSYHGGPTTVTRCTKCKTILVGDSCPDCGAAE